MNEELLVTARSNALIDPALHIWTWEVAMYLFLGGLTAGVMVFAALIALTDRDEEAPFAGTRLALFAPIVLSLGMLTLFLDLEHKTHVFRFYTAFKPLSPMSWGSWILIAIYPLSILQILSTIRAGWWPLAALADSFAPVRALIDWSERHRLAIAAAAVPLGIALGIYTGILLSAFSARPFWNSGILGPLFLVSGLSTAAALVAIATREPLERHLFTKIDLVLIAVEILLVGLFIVSLATGSRQHLDALDSVMGGPYTLVFWVVFVGIGLLVPLVLEVFELRGTLRSAAVLAPLLVLIGGYALRQVMLDVGQESTWTSYPTQYNAELLERLREHRAYPHTAGGP
jgi:formate-dependent nitrite reductase membrane component NrfD